MTPRDELAGWLRSVFIAHRAMFETANPEAFKRLADEVIAVGWQAPPRVPEQSVAKVLAIPAGACSVRIEGRLGGEVTARFGFWGDADLNVRIT